MSKIAQKKYKSKSTISERLSEKSNSTRVSYGSNSVNKGNSGNHEIRNIKKINKILSEPIVNLSDLKIKCFNGISQEHPVFHAMIWKYILGIYPCNKKDAAQKINKRRTDYIKLCKFYENKNKDNNKKMDEKEEDLLHQISIDVNRTLPESSMFRISNIQKMLSRILTVWSKENPVCSYVQGLNDLCVPFFVVYLNEYFSELKIDDIVSLDKSKFDKLNEKHLMEIECDIYASFSSLMNKIKNNYIKEQPGIIKILNKLQSLIKLNDNQLFSHLTKYDIKPIHYAFRWTNCYFLREFNIPTIIRLWDAYLGDDNSWEELHVFVCEYLLLHYRNDILKIKDFQDIAVYLQNLPTKKWNPDNLNVILSKAYGNKILHNLKK